jgi:S-adenosylmethionine uptake transporter
LGTGAVSLDSARGMGAILCSAVLYAINLVMQRHQAQQASAGEIAFFQSLFMGLFMGVAAMAVPWLGAMAWPPVGAWHRIAGAALLATISLFLLSWGWARAPAHRLLPIEYSAFIWSAATGYWWFGERLGWATLVGAGLIVAGCWHGTNRSGSIEQTAL